MDNERIKKYLANELSPEERNAFEQEMENDPFLMESVEGLQELVADTPGWSADKTVPELHNRIDDKIQQPRKGTIIPLNFFRYAVAACVIGMLAFVSWRLLINNTGINEEAIYAGYFKPLTHPDATVRGENISSDATAAIQAYEKEDYFEAVRLYEKLVAYNPSDVRNSLFLGISYLASNQPKKAVELLHKISSAEEYRFDVQWYLALAYIKLKDVQHAQESLELLTEENNYYTEKALEIRDMLNGKIAAK